MRPVEQLQAVLDAELRQLGGERLRSEVQEVFVGAAGVEVDPPHRPQRVGVAGRHPHRVALEPRFPDIHAQSPGRELDRQDDPTVAPGVRRVCGRHRIEVQEGSEAAVVEAVGRSELPQKSLDRSVEVVAEAADRDGKLGQVADLEQRVARVRGERAEPVGAQHRHDHRPVAAGGLSGDPPVVAVRRGRVAAVDEGNDLVAQVVEVAPGRRGVEELRTAERGPGVDIDDDRVGAAFPGVGEHRVEPLDRVRFEGRPRQPRSQAAR